MKYRIAYDQPGRLRVRFGPDAFTQEQGYGIAALLLGCPGITGAETCPVNGSVLVLYRGDGRAAALAVLGYTSAEVAQALKGVDVETLSLEEIIRQCLKKMVK